MPQADFQGAEPAPRALVVSLHDVSPLTQPACARIIEALAQLGLRRLALLVIANHHGRAPITEAADFCQWLRARAAEGHEIVTHGYFHRRERQAKEGVMQRLTTQVYTAGEGEFHDLPEARAAELVRQANDELRAAGLAPHGFIAPAWLLGPEAEAGVRAAGAEYTTRLREVQDFHTGRRTPAQSECWSTRAAWRRALSLLWNAALHRRLRRAPLLRIAVHPGDVEHPGVWRQIRRHTARALARREALTYWEWIAQQRARR
jgi:predicted deacetylase